LYEGQNRSRGATYTFFVKPGDSRDTSIKAKSVSDSAMVRIYNGGNELIRTMKIKADTGFNKNYWGFEMKGTRQPGSPKPKAGTAEPAGLSVYPGIYKLVVSLGKEIDSTLITVNADPNVPNDKEIYDAKMAMIKRLDKSTTRLAEITDRLADAEESIVKVDAELKNVEGKEADSLRKVGRAMTDSIKSIRNFIFGKPQEKQGYGAVYQVTANGILNEARQEVLNKTKIPDSQETRMAEEAEGLVSEAVQKANAFFTGKWRAYQQQAESTPVKLFKEYKPVE
jgi:hypothetical protein